MTCYMWHVTCDMWHVTCDMWNVTCEMWQVICDMWHVTCDKGHVTCDMRLVTYYIWHMTYALWVESLMVSSATQVSPLRRHGSHSPGQLFSLSQVEADYGYIRFSLSKAGQPIQQWWLLCNFWMAQSPCSLFDMWHMTCDMWQVTCDMW